MSLRTGEIAPSAVAIAFAAMFVIGTVLAYLCAPIRSASTMKDLF